MSNPLNSLLGPHLKKLEVIIPLLNGSSRFLLLGKVGPCGLLLECCGSLSELGLLLNGLSMDGVGNPFILLNF